MKWGFYQQMAPINFIISSSRALWGTGDGSPLASEARRDSRVVNICESATNRAMAA